MTSVKTTGGRRVSHCHVPRRPCGSELTEDEVAEAREMATEFNPAAVEISPPTARFNCHGFAYASSHGWFNHPERFFEDDFDQLALESARVNDVVIYMNDDTLMHSGKITRVVGGTIVEVESKWGELALLSHSLRGVPPIYGDPSHVLRRREVS